MGTVQIASFLALAALAACAAPAGPRVELDPGVRASAAWAQASDGALCVTLQGVFLHAPAARELRVVARDEAGAVLADQPVRAALLHAGGPGRGVDRARLDVALPAGAVPARVAVAPAR